MGTIINFPEVQHVGRDLTVGDAAQSAVIMILPVVRIERDAGRPSDDGDPATQGASGKRGRRARRP